MNKKLLLTGSSLGDTINIYEDSIELAQTGLMSKATKGLTGSKTVPFESITSIQYRKANWVNSGYIQIGIKGYEENKKGLKGASQDENSIVFWPTNNEIFKQIADLMQEKIIEFSSKVSNNATGQISISEEIEKLNNLFKSGAISEEEFTKAKDKLIS
tara:strand:- start:999 stop:1472 length:474 start_codon:yes stop_codon:yes gene_type:complete